MLWGTDGSDHSSHGYTIRPAGGGGVAMIARMVKRIDWYYHRKG
jgi:hypothetical protein